MHSESVSPKEADTWEDLHIQPRLSGKPDDGTCRNICMSVGRLLNLQCTYEGKQAGNEKHGYYLKALQRTGQERNRN